MLSTPFDILRRLKDGGCIWLEAVRGLQKAKTRLKQLCAMAPGEYFVFDQKAQKIVAQIAQGTIVDDP